VAADPNAVALLEPVPGIGDRAVETRAFFAVVDHACTIAIMGSVCVRSSPLSTPARTIASVMLVQPAATLFDEPPRGNRLPANCSTYGSISPACAARMFGVPSHN